MGGESNGNDSIKVETVTENDADDENMESLLASFGDDGDFMTQDEKEKAAAEERRRKRRRRLERLEASVVADASVTKSVAKTTAAVPMQTAIKKEEGTSIPQQQSDDDHLRVMKAFHKQQQDETKEVQDDNESNNSDSDDSDMFASPSSEDRARKEEKKRKRNNNNGQQNNNSSNTDNDKGNSRQDGFDDSDGYYKAAIGETMELEIAGSRNQSEDLLENNNAWTLKLRVLGIIGKGVFSSVLKCSTTTTDAASTRTDDGIPTTISISPNNDRQRLPPEVAIKCIRSNETMAKAALDEMKFLIRLRDSPGVVPLLLPTGQSGHNPNYVPPPIDYRGHTLLVFPDLPYNLRDVLQKFGKGVGLSLGAVQNYFKQLLNAAIHLQTKGVIHADIKPDNILVTPDFSKVLVADFGSAVEAEPITQDGEQTTSSSSILGIAKGQAVANEAVTPYLVSRFYRAPEIILGLQPLTYAIDLWSLAVTAGELFLGSVLLKGANNNDMLYTMMKLLGPFSGRIVKSHLLQTKKHPLQAHFSQVQSNFVFCQETLDPISNLAVHKEIALNSKTFQPTLQSKLLKAKSPKDKRSEVLAFADLLNSCLVLDPSKRSSVRAARKHKFFVPQPQDQTS